MSNKTRLKENLKKEKAKLQKEISSLNKTMKDYKIERKANWKSFKNGVKDDVNRIEKSIDKLTARKMIKQVKITLPSNGSAHKKEVVNEIEK